MPQTAYCHHCGSHQPLEKMRLVVTKGGKRWRCIESIAASKNGRLERDAYGQQVSASRKLEMGAMGRRSKFVRELME